MVTDFEATPEIDAIDRGFSARMDRNGTNYPILERKRRTLARVNVEIVASIVATLREAGLERSPAARRATLSDHSAVLSGRLRGGEGGNGKKPSASHRRRGDENDLDPAAASRDSSTAQFPASAFYDGISTGVGSRIATITAERLRRRSSRRYI